MRTILERLFKYESLSGEETKALLHGIANGEFNNSQIASLITTYLMREISIDELNGFTEALLEACHAVEFDGYTPIDIVGTGGDGKDTFNISTCSSFVVAASGYPVAKHGNYAASSVSGASNVMELSGVKFTNDRDTLRRSMDECNMAYLHAPLFNPAIKAVTPIRRELGVRSFFNILGPLVNPAKPKYQLLGVYNLSLLRLYSYIFQTKMDNFAVVHSLDGYDEISLTSDFRVSSAAGEHIYTPQQLGFDTYKESDLYGGTTCEEAAQIFHNVLNNCSTAAQRDVVLANSALAISVASDGKTFEESIAIAKETLESGKAAQTFKRFIEINS